MILRVDFPLKLQPKLVTEFRARLIRHLTRLSPDDRYLRFFSSANDNYIEAYVDRILRSEKDGLFLAYDETGEEVIGMLNIGLTRGSEHGELPEYELGISVDAEQRGKGLGYDLFKTAFNWVSALGASRIFVSCLSQNIPMQKIVKKFNIEIDYEGNEQHATIMLPGVHNPVGVMVGNATNWCVLYDLMYRRQLQRMWRS